MISFEAKLARGTIIIVAALVVLRLIAAAITPLTFDESYYWTWAKHLSGGYYDHPPMVAVVIRLGIMIAGDTEFGVRLVSILLALPMSWAIYRAAQILFDDARIAAASTVFLNATLMASVGTTIVTPDAPLMVAASFVLFGLAKVWQTGRGVWWLAVGVAVGCCLLSKYTALFFGAQILLWLLLMKDQRRWLAAYLREIDRVAAHLGRRLWEVPVGFKWFVPGLVDGSVAFGGEESAGASFLRLDGTAWTTDKDGILLALLASEILAVTGKTPSQLYAELVAEFGDPAYERVDAAASPEQKARLGKLSGAAITATELAGDPITAKLSEAPGNGAAVGGVKVTTEFAWFAARPSGTEDVYKIYAESFRGPEHLKLVQAEAKSIVDAALGG